MYSKIMIGNAGLDCNGIRRLIHNSGHKAAKIQDDTASKRITNHSRASTASMNGKALLPCVTHTGNNIINTAWPNHRLWPTLKKTRIGRIKLQGEFIAAYLPLDQPTNIIAEPGLLWSEVWHGTPSPKNKLTNQIWEHRPRFPNERLFFSALQLAGCGAVQFVSQFEGGVFDLLADSTGPHALGTNFHGFRAAVRRRRFDVLEVRQKRATGNAGDFRADAAEILGLTACFDMVSDRSAFSADFTYSCHEFQSLYL